MDTPPRGPGRATIDEVSVGEVVQEKQMERTKMTTSLGPGSVLGASKWYGTDVLVVATQYASDGSLAVLAVLPSGEVYGKYSVNLSGHGIELAHDEFVVQHAVPERDARRLLFSGVPVEDTGKRVSYGYVENRPVFRLTIPVEA